MPHTSGDHHMRKRVHYGFGECKYAILANGYEGIYMVAPTNTTRGSLMHSYHSPKKPGCMIAQVGCLQAGEKVEKIMFCSNWVMGVSYPLCQISPTSNFLEGFRIAGSRKEVQGLKQQKDFAISSQGILTCKGRCWRSCHLGLLAGASRGFPSGPLGM